MNIDFRCVRKEIQTTLCNVYLVEKIRALEIIKILKHCNDKGMIIKVKKISLVNSFFF